MESGPCRNAAVHASIPQHERPIRVFQAAAIHIARAGSDPPVICHGALQPTLRPWPIFGLKLCLQQADKTSVVLPKSLSPQDEKSLDFRARRTGAAIRA